MVLKAGLDLPSADTITSGLPSLESISEGIENTSSLGELERTNQALINSMQAPLEPEVIDDTPQVFYSPSTRKMFVNGLMFDDDDASTALQSVNQLNARPVKPSPNVATDWSRISPEDYGSYIKGIKNPQAGRLFSENLDIGGSNLKMLGGRALQFFGAEETGQSLVDEAAKEIQKNEPFQREFTKIKSGYIQDGDAGESHDAIDWFIANFAQQIPNLLESLGAGLLGYGAGSIAGGGSPLAGIGGAISAITKKENYKRAVIKAAEKYQKDMYTLTAGERKLLREVSSLAAVASGKNNAKVLAVNAGGKRDRLSFDKDTNEPKIIKKYSVEPTSTSVSNKLIREGLAPAAARIREVGKAQAKKGGAATGLGISSYGIGIGDVYGEQREMGQDDRLSAAFTAIPYAAFEMLPEFVLASRIFGVGPKAFRGAAGDTKTGKVLKGFGVGGALEGTTEVAQESLILANTGQLDLNSPQVKERLTNAFAAGFFVGGPIGAAANLLAKPSTDILDRGNSRTEPNDPIDFTDEQPSPFVGGQQPSRKEMFDVARGFSTVPASAQTNKEIDALENEIKEEGKKKLQETGTRDFPVAVLPENTQLGLPNIETEASAQTNKEINELQKRLNANKKEGDQLELDVGAPPVGTTTANTGAISKNLFTNDTKKEKPTIHKTRGKRIKEGRGEGASAIVTGEIVTVGNKEALITGYISTADKSNLENPSQLGFDNLARYSYEYLDGTGTGLSTESNVVNDNKELLTKPLNAKALKEAKARIKKREDRIKKEDAAKRKEEIERDAATLKAQKENQQLDKEIDDEIDRIITGGQDDAVQERSTEEISDGRETRDSKTVRKGNTKESETPKETGLKKSGGKKKTGKAKLQAKEEEDSVRKADEKPVAKPEDKTGEDNVTDTRTAAEKAKDSIEEIKNKGKKTNVDAAKFLKSKGKATKTDKKIIKKAAVDKLKTDADTKEFKRETVEVSGKKFWNDNKKKIPGASTIEYGNFTTPSQTKIDELAKDSQKAGVLEELKAVWQEGFEAMIEDKRMNTQDYVQLQIDIINESNVNLEREYAYAEIMEYTSSEWMGGFGGQNRKARDKAEGFLKLITLDKDYIQDLRILDSLVIEKASKLSNAQIENTKSLKIEQRSWYKYAEGRGLLTSIDNLRTSGADGNRLAPFVAMSPNALGPTIEPKIFDARQKAQSQEKLVAKVEKYISDLLAGVGPKIYNQSSLHFKLINREYAKLTDEQKNSMLGGTKLKFYFDEKTNKLKIEEKEVGKELSFIPTTKTQVQRQKELDKKLVDVQENKLKKKLTKEEEKRLANERAEQDAREAQQSEKDFYQDDDGFDGGYLRFDGTVANPLPKGKVRILANQAVSQLKIKPKVTVVSNYADLEANYPKLYKRAKDGRAKYKDDFGTINAVGYSIGDQVIIFSDFVRTEQQLKFVIAHETMGHFGLKSLISQKQFNTVMQDVYDSDKYIKAVADLNIDNGMEKFEAIEEAVADAAAFLDVSTISRIMNAIKVFLNKYLGTNLEAVADGSRYLIYQSRKYLRTGDIGSYVSVGQLLTNVKELEQQRDYGRYNVETYRDGVQDSLNKSFGLNRHAGENGGFAGAINYLTQFWTNKSGKFENMRRGIDRTIEGIQSLNNLANKNAGSQEGYNILQQIQAQVRAYVGKYADMTPMTFKPNSILPFGDSNAEPDTVEIKDSDGNTVTVANDAGLTALEREQVGQLKAFAALYLRNKNSKSKIADLKLDDLIITKDKDGNTLSEFVYDEEAFKKIKEAAKLTKEDFENGFEIPTALDKDGKPLEEQGGYTFRTSTPTRRGEAPGQFEPFVISDRVFRAYEEATEVVAEGSKDVLESNIRGVVAQRDAILESLRDVSNGTLEGNHLLAIENIMKKYKQLYFENHTINARGEIKLDKESEATADRFLQDAQRAMFKEEKIQDWIAQDSKEVPVYERENAVEEFADIRSGLEDLHQILKGKASKAYDIKKEVESLIILDRENVEKSFTTKASILGGYVPFTRRGDTQVTVRAFTLDENGNPDERITLDDSLKDSMPYYQTFGKEDADSIRDKINDVFNPVQEGEKPKYVPFTVKDINGNTIENVAFVAETSGIQEGQPFQNEMDIYLFNRKIKELGFNASPKQRERITRELTKQEDRARSSLERSGNPGWDRDVLKNVAEHLEQQAHLVGRNFHRYKIDRLMDSEAGTKLWFGDRKKLDRLHDQLKAAEEGDNQAAKEEARRKYDRYANQYRYSAGSRQADTPGSTVTVYKNKGVLGLGEREAVEMPMLARGNDYKTRFRGIIDYYARNPNISETTEDAISRSKTGQALKLLTVTSQLGGSIATGYVNALAMQTHSVNFLAGYNPESGFGGGFGFMKSQRTMYKALTQMNDIFGTLRNQYTIEEQYEGRNVDLAGLNYVEQMAGVDNNGNVLTDAKDQERAQKIRDKHGLTQDEATVIYQTTKAGVLQASQYNALIGTARGGLGNVKLAAAVKKWMSIFSYTEQLNRRTTFLASYRLQRDKIMTAKDETEASAETIAEASQWARDAVNTSQGEYSMFNRPELSRGNLTNYLMVYKQFMIISVELMSNMPRAQQLAFLGILWFMSGLKGLPGAEDLADVLDTLFQKFGFEIGTIEKEANDFFEDILPGSAKVIMRGPLDAVTGATMSTRLGMGDLIPLSGVGKAGSNVWRETQNFLGPVWSAADAGLATIGNIALATGSLVGLSDRQVGLTTILRQQPFGGIRGITDSIVFAMNGKITNRDGKVITSDVGVEDIVFRFLNFYPAAANYQNDIIRMHKQTSDYVKALKMEFTQDYVKAKINGDRDTMREVMRDVSRHNAKHSGTAFEFRDWQKSAERAYKSWSLPAAERYRKFAPKNIRPDLKRIMDAYSIDDM